jgi:hypothetical protein
MFAPSISRLTMPIPRIRIELSTVEEELQKKDFKQNQINKREKKGKEKGEKKSKQVTSSRLSH